MDKRKIVLNLLKKNPNTPFTPNEIAVSLKSKNKDIRIHHPEVLRILLEEYARNPEKIGYKKVARIHLFWFRENVKRQQR